MCMQPICSFANMSTAASALRCAVTINQATRIVLTAKIK